MYPGGLASPPRKSSYPGKQIDFSSKIKLFVEKCDFIRKALFKSKRNHFPSGNLIMLQNMGSSEKYIIKKNTISATFASYLHHVGITFPPFHLHYVSRTFASHLHYIYVTFALHLHHICFTFASHLPYICITFALHLHHICFK